MAGWGTGWGSGYGGSGIIAWGLDADGDPIPIPPGLLNTKQTATDMLWKVFEGQPNWVNILTAIGCAYGDVNAQQFDIENFRSLSTAFGVTMDDVGGMVGLARGSLNDDDYRKAIAVEAKTLIASGTRPEILELARALFPLVPPIQLIDFYPGSWDLRIKNLSAGDLDLIEIIFEDVPNSGVRGFISTYLTGEAGGWDFDSGTDPDLLGFWGWDTPGDADPERSHWIHERVIGE